MKWSSLAVAIAAGLLVAGWASAQESTAKAEALAVAETARLVQQTRQEKGLRKLGLIRDDRLRGQACARATRGDESATIVSGFFREKVGTMSVVLYSTSDPSQPAPAMLDWAGDKARSEQPDWTRFAVGVCFMHTAKYPEGRYWVCASKYLGAVKTFFFRFVWD